MPRSRREKTLADYVVIALTPALVMALVGSLVFFLLEVSYTGQFEGRLRWILFWFVFASVLIARIAIEQGSEHASLYGLAMAAATAIVIARYVDSPLVAWALLGVIWWCSQTLTWDCTMIDELADSSGEGLLQIAGLRSRSTTKVDAGAAETDAKNSNGADEDDDDEPETGTKRKKPHAPGLWVVYFSFAALPLFGLGQLLLPAADPARRDYGFRLLAIYVASALALLLTTSFLGLRRYLRQRKLKMPVKMTATWLSMGLGLVVTIMLVCLLLPRPNSQYAMNDLIDRVASTAQKASKYAMLRSDSGRGEGRTGEDKNQTSDGEQHGGEGAASPQGGKPAQSNENKSSSNPADGGKKPSQAGGKETGKNQGKAGKSDDSQSQAKGDRQPSAKSQNSANDETKKSSDQSSAAKQSQSQQAAAEKSETRQSESKSNDSAKQTGTARNAKGEKTAGQKRNSSSSAAQKSFESPPQFSPQSIVDSLAGGLKWIIYGVLGLIAAWVIIRNWSRVVEFISRLLQELLDLWNGLFGGKRDDSEESGKLDSEAEIPIAPFAEFDDPFANGRAKRIAPSELVRYTFDGLQAWACEQGFPRQSQQTPGEFAALLGTRIPAMGRDVAHLTELYARMAYAGREPTRENAQALERLWRRMKSTAARQPQSVEGA